MTVIGTASIPIKLDFSGLSKQISEAGKDVTDRLTREISGGLHDEKSRFVKAGQQVGDDVGKGVDKGAKNAADGLTSHFKGAFTKIAALGSGLLIGAQIVSTFKTAFGEAEEAQKIGRLTEQVIKSTGGAAKITAAQIGDLATAISNKAGMDDEAIQSGANLLATFTKVRNEAGKGNDIFSRTVGLATDMSVALGQDMKSSSLQLGKALNDPIKGVTALGRAGVSFTKDQKEQIKTMQESGDLLGAQKLILKEVEIQFGGAAAAAASPVDKLKVVWGNLLEDIGTRAMPIVTSLAGWVGKMLPKALNFLGDAFNKVAGPARQLFDIFVHRDFTGGALAEDSKIVDWAFRIRDAFTALVGVGRQFFNILFKGDFTGGFFAEDSAVVDWAFRVRDAFFSLVDGLKAVAVAAVKGVGWVIDFVKANPGPVFAAFGAVIAAVLVPAAIAWATSMASAAIATIVATAPVILIGAAIALLAGGIVYAYQHFEVFRNVVDTVVDVVKEYWKVIVAVALAFVSFTSPVLLAVAAVVALGLIVWDAYQRFEVFRNVVDTVARAIRDVAMKAFEGLVLLWDNVLLPAIQRLAGFFVNTLWPAVQSTWDLISKAIVFAWQNVILPTFNFISAVITNVLIPAFNIIKTVVVDFVFPLVMAIVREVWDVLQPIFGAISWYIGNIVVPAFQSIWNVVSSVWGFIRPVFEEIIKFVQEKLTPVWQGIAWAVSAAFDAIPGLIAGALRLVGGIVAGFLDGVGSIADAIGLDDIAKVLRSGAGSARGWGQGPTAPARIGGIRVEGGIRRNAGGGVPGPNVDADIVPAMLTPGEFVIRRDAVEKYGAGFMAQINAGRYRKGGLIPDIDLPGFADGVVDKVRSVGTSALESVWPRLATGNKLTGLPAGGANYLRDAVIQLIRGKEQQMGSQSGGGFSRAGGGGPAGQYTAGMQRARADILNLFGPMAVGGYANRNIAGTGQKSMHALHRAWDFMTGQNVPRGNAVSRHLIANASSYGLKGLIWNAQKNFGSGWQPYGHPGGGRSATLQHLDHVHAEFFSKGGKVPYGLYDQGGFLPPGLSIAENRTGAPERVGGAGIAVGEVHLHGLEDVAAFWQMAEFHAMKGSFG